MPPRIPKSVTTSSEREVIYPKLNVALFTGEQPLAAHQAKQLLGWTQPKDKEPFKEYLFKDRNKITTVCSNNNANRSFYLSLALRWMYEILSGRWKLNGETLIIGKTGVCLDCQHRLVGLVWAVQEFINNPAKYPFWKTEPTMDCIIVFGIEESLEVANTINVGKTRSLADAVFASGIFTGTTSQVKKYSRSLDYAIRLLWERTGAFENAFSSHRSHQEALDFFRRHPSLKDTIELVHKLDAKYKGRLKQLLSLGYLSALAYLMSIDSSCGKAYHECDNPSEEQIKFKHKQLVIDYLEAVAIGIPKANEVTRTIATMQRIQPLAETLSVFIIGWNVWLAQKKIPTGSINLEYATRDEQTILLSKPTLGGIDLGAS